MAEMIAFVDDTSEDRLVLRGMLRRYFAESGFGSEVEFEEFTSAEAFLASYHPGRFKLVFFDIYMGGMTGMDAARQVFHLDPDCRLIFITTSREYAVDSYEVRASYYLLKPLEYNKLQEALDGIFRKTPEDTAQLTVHLKGSGMADILMREILYVDCVKKTVILHKLNHNFMLSDRLMDISERLVQEPRFLCCNRGIYVNMDWIEKLGEHTLILKNKEELPVRIRGYVKVKQQYLRYSLDDLRRDE